MSENHVGPARISERRTPQRQPLVNRVMLTLLRSPLRPLLGSGMLAVRYVTRDGRQITLPVGFVPSLLGLVVLVGRSDRKRWWRHFQAANSMQVWWRGAWRPTTAKVALPGSAEHRD